MGKGLALATLITIFSSAHAQTTEGKTSLRAEDVKIKTPDTDVDTILTNEQLRAMSGSKSKYSITSSLGYSGSTIDRPLSENRPNLSGTTGTTDTALLSGQVAAQYNWRPVHAFLAGAGVRWIAPLEANRPKNYEGSRLDAANPYFSYQHIYNWRGLESVLQLQATFFTNSDLLRRGYDKSLTLSQESSYKVGESGLSIGFGFWAQVSHYTRKGELGTPDDSFYMKDVRDDQSDYGAGIEPKIEYELSEHWSVRSQTALWAFEHVRSASNPNTYVVDRVQETLGIGISITRDINLFPNIAFLPENIRSDRTNVGLSADINVF